MSRRDDRDGPDRLGKESAELEDTEELVNRRRIESVIEARERVRDVRLTALERVDLGEQNRETANAQIARATKAFIRELEYPLANTDTGTEYWESAELGRWEIHPPTPERLAWAHKLKNEIGNTHNEDYSELPSGYELEREADRQPKVIPVVGLKQYLNLGPTEQVEHSAAFHIRFHGTEQITRAAEHAIPERISTAAYRACNRFLGEINLGIEATEDDTDEWEI